MFPDSVREPVHGTQAKTRRALVRLLTAVVVWACPFRACVSGLVGVPLPNLHRDGCPKVSKMPTPQKPPTRHWSMSDLPDLGGNLLDAAARQLGLPDREILDATGHVCAMESDSGYKFRLAEHLRKLADAVTRPI